MNHLGIGWTFRSDGCEATNLGLLCGNTVWRKTLTLKLIEATAAELPVTSYASRHQAVGDGPAQCKRVKTMRGLLELVARQLAEPAC